MSQIRLAIWSVVVLTGLMAVALLLRRSTSMTPAQLEAGIKSYAESGRLARYDLPSFGEADERIDIIYLNLCVQLAKMRYGKQLRGFAINPPSIDPSLVNLIFFKDDPERLFRDFQGNCTYTGYKNVIVCDLRFLHELTGVPEEIPRRLEGIPKGGVEELSEKDLVDLVMAVRASTALWVLGHEIGHLARGHESRHFLFRDDRSDALIRNADGHPKGRSYVAEQEADQFAFDVIKETGVPSFGFFLWIGLSQTVVHLANKQLIKQGEQPDTVFGIENRRYRIKAESQTHPPTFVRAVVIAQQLAEGLQLDNTGHFRRIYEHIEVY